MVTSAQMAARRSFEKFLNRDPLEDIKKRSEQRKQDQENLKKYRENPKAPWSNKFYASVQRAEGVSPSVSSNSASSNISYDNRFVDLTGLNSEVNKKYSNPIVGRVITNDYNQRKLGKTFQYNRKDKEKEYFDGYAAFNPEALEYLNSFYKAAGVQPGDLDTKKTNDIKKAFDESEKQYKDSIVGLMGGAASIRAAMNSNDPLQIKELAKKEAMFTYNRNGGVSDQYDLSAKDVAEMCEGKYAYGLSEEDFKKWQKDNMFYKWVKDKKTGEKKKEYFLKMDAKPLPVNAYQNEKGEIVKLSDDERDKLRNSWYYFTEYNKASSFNKVKEEELGQDRKEATEYYNSAVDVIRAVARGENAEDAVSKYSLNKWGANGFNPSDLLSGQGIVNVLMELGDTLDVFVRPLRSVAADQNNSIRFAQKGSAKHSDFTGEETFLMSSGKKVQKKLIKLGLIPEAYKHDIDFEKIGKSIERGRSTRFRASGDARNKEADKLYKTRDELYKEARKKGGKKLENQLRKFYKEYDEWSDSHHKGFWKSVKEGFIGKEDYNVNTGNTVVDIIAETAMDPTLVVGGIGRGAVKGVARNVTEDIVKGGLKTFDAHTLANVSKDTLNGLNKMEKRMIRNIRDNIFNKSEDEVVNSITRLRDLYADNGLIRKGFGNTFVDYAMKEYHAFKDMKMYKFLRGAQAVSNASDVVDSALLKGSFIAPYSVYKYGNFMRKAVRQYMYETPESWLYKHAVNRINKKTIQHAGENPSIVNVDEYFSNLNKEAVDGDSKINMYTDVLHGMSENTIRQLNAFDQVIVDLQKTDSVEDIRNALDAKVTEMTHQKCSSLSEYKEMVERFNNKYGKAFDELKAHIDERVDRIEKWFEVKEATTKFKEYDKLLKSEDVSDTVQKLVNNEDEYLRSVGREVYNSDNYKIYEDLVSEEQQINERIIILNDIFKERYFEGKEVFLDEYKGLQKRLDDVAIQKQNIKDNLKVDLDKAIESVQDQYKASSVFRDEPIESNKFLNDVLDYDKPVMIKDKLLESDFYDVKGDIDRVLDQIEYIERTDTPDYVYNLKGLLSDIDNSSMFDVNKVLDLSIKSIVHNTLKGDFNDLSDILLKNLEKIRDIANKVDRYEIKPHAEYIQYQRDKFVVYDRYLRNKAFNDLMYKLYDKDTSCGKLLYEIGKISELKSTRREDIVSEYLGTGFTKRKSKETSAIMAFVYNVLDINDNIHCHQYLIDFWNNLSSSDLLSNEDVLAVLETLFGRTYLSPKDLVNVKTPAMDQFLDSVELYKTSLYGESKLSLDNFRYEALDFSNDFYKKYKKEVQNPEIQNRISKILEGGHEDPLDDVRVQMLQVILKDPDAIEKYNALSKNRGVFFTDIETTGFNDSLDKITSLAFKEWREIKGDSLSEILDLIEEGGKTYQTKTLNKELRTSIDDRILELNYGKDHTIANNREARLDAYCKKFGTDKPDEVITEEDIISKFMGELDTSYLNNSKQVPTIITHNNNNFDMKKLKIRASSPEYGNRTFTVHIKNFDELIKYQQNTLIDLKTILDDKTVLTSEQRDYIKYMLAEYATKVSRYKYDFKIIEPKEMLDSFNTVKRLMSRDIIEKNVLSGIFDNEQKIVFQKDLNYVCHEFDKAVKTLNSTGCMENRVFQNPFKMTIENTTEWTKYFDEDEIDIVKDALKKSDDVILREYNTKLQRKIAENMGYDWHGQNNLMRAIKEIEGGKLPTLSYQKIFEVDDVSKFFDVVGQKLSINDMRVMQKFTKQVMNTRNFKLKATGYIKGKTEEFNKVIDFFKKVAFQLGPGHELYFMTYLGKLNSDIESYLVARELYDYIKSFCKNSKKGVEQTICKTIVEDIFSESDNVLPFKKFSIWNVRKGIGVDSDLIRILDGKYDSYIYKGIKNDDVTYRYEYELANSKDVEYRDKLEKFAHEDNTLADYFTIFDTTPEFDAKYMALNMVMTDSTENIRYYLGLLDKDQRRFQYEQKAEYDRVCKLQTAQILDYITESEENLISHLLFHNQILRIATHGDQDHLLRINKLIDRLNKWSDSKYIESNIGETYIDISIKKEWTHKIQVRNDSRIIDVKNKARNRFEFKKEVDDWRESEGWERTHKIGGEFNEPEMSFIGESNTYKRPNYASIEYNPAAFSNGRLGKHIERMREEISRLSLGASTGSINVSWTLKKHREVFENLPPEFRKRIVDVDFTCNERFWHNANYDMCLLGDAKNRWKPHVQNDEDILLNHRQVLSYTAQKAKDIMLFTDSFFGSQSSMGIKNIFPFGFTDKEIVESLKNNRDLVVVTLSNSKMTDSGMEIKILDIQDELGVKLAQERNAIVVPYGVYTEMNEVINKYTSPYVLHFYNKFLTIIKALQLANPGTWIRNIVDGSIKAMSDTNDTFGYMKNCVRAMDMRKSYFKIQNVIEDLRGFEYNSDLDIERIWDDLMITTHCDLTYKEYQMLDGWFNRGESGGASKETLEILRASERSKNISKMFREDNGFDIVADNMVKFEQLNPERVKDAFNKVFRVNEVPGMTIDEYMNIFLKKVDPSDSKYIVYKDISDRIMTYLGAKDMSLGYKLDNNLTRFITGALKPMSYSEEIMRLSQYLTLSDQGYTPMEIFRHIKDTQFDYDFKTWKSQFASMIIPYFSFQKENMLYWLRMVNDNPKFLRILEHLYSELSWDFDDYSAEDILSNKALEFLITSGQIPIGDTGLTIKINPSFLDALKWIDSPVSAFATNSVDLNIINFDKIFVNHAEDWRNFMDMLCGQGIIKKIADGFGADAYDMFDIQESQYYTNIPFINGYFSAKSSLEKLSLNNSSTLSELVLISNPWLFGAIASYKGQQYDSYNTFLEGLKKQGKWYDMNSGKVVPLELLNADGLNNPLLSFEERNALMLKNKGKIWDANQNKFVDFLKFTPGGLNRKFDFSRPGEWEEFCKLKERICGVVWDNNVKAFVDPKDLTKGMLNDPNLSFEEVCYWNKKLFGTLWDANQNKFVDKDHYIPGGLNDKDLSWDELTKLMYYINGKEWNGSKFVQTRDPIIIDETPYEDYVVKKKVLREGKNEQSNWASFWLLGADTAYSESSSYDIVEDIKEKPKYGKDVLFLSGDPKHDKEVFDKILAMPSVAPVSSRSKNYKSGLTYEGYRYNKKQSVKPYYNDIVRSKPNLSSTYRNARNFGVGIKSGGKIYSRPYEGSDNQSGLRMATSGYKAYDDYYRFEEAYQYKYHKNNKIGDYPQLQTSIQRYSRSRYNYNSAYNKIRYGAGKNIYAMYKR